MLHHAYFSYILAGAAEGLYEQDMRLVLSPTMHEHHREVSLLERLMHGTTDGAVIILPEESSDELELLLNHGYRFVVIDPLLPLNERIPAVSAAHAAGADQAMKHLLSLGHTRIAAITGPRGWKATEDRRRGYYAALAAAGIMPDPELEVESNFEITSVPANDTVIRIDSPKPSACGRPGPPTISATPPIATAIATQVRRLTGSPTSIPNTAASTGASACMKRMFATDA